MPRSYIGLTFVLLGLAGCLRPPPCEPQVAMVDIAPLAPITGPPLQVDATRYIESSSKPGGVVIADYCVLFKADGEAQMTTLITRSENGDIEFRSQEMTPSEAKDLQTKIDQFFRLNRANPSEAQIVCMTK